MLSIFFVCSQLFIVSFSSAQSCTTRDGVEKAQVKWVYDGDTIKLTDNRKIRIIGIDTPEVVHRRGKGNKNNQTQAEPYAGEATEALRELLAKHRNQVIIKTGKQKKDKYGRVLAHVFTADGTNISEWLLQRGFASLLMIPPNMRFLDCYHLAESNAQKKKLKIWQLQSHQVRTTSNLNPEFSGYIRLSGTVKGFKRRKNKISIKLDHQIYITIKKPDLKWFRQLDQKQLKGKIIQVTGILYRHGKKGFIRLRHPVYLNY